MRKTVTFNEFENWFQEHRPNNFSKTGIRGFFDYLEWYEESTGESIEFDPISLCVEYTEYEDLNEFHCSYDKEEYPNLDTIQDYTHVIELENKGFILQDF